MYVELKGVNNFANKGAELMLRSILQQLNNNFSNLNFVMEYKSKTYAKMRDLGIKYQKFYRYRSGFQWGRLIELIPRKLRLNYHLVIDPEIDLLLDASGFTYSSQFKRKTTMEMAEVCIRRRKLGKKTIFLPQAFGPFNGIEIRRAFKTIVDNSDLIFARDLISYKHIVDVVGEEPNNVKLAPDFTNLVQGVLRDCHKKFKNQVAIIPNRRMIQKTSALEQENYIPFLVKCINMFREKGLETFFLIHEIPGHDYEIALDIQEKIGVPLEIVSESNPLYIKGIIGICHSVVCSRFHGLINALSQSVPTIATGWSHKYQMLFKDYNCEEFLLSVNDDLEKIQEKIELITGETTRPILIKKLQEVGNIQKAKVLNMWNEVFEIIRNIQ